MHDRAALLAPLVAALPSDPAERLASEAGWKLDKQAGHARTAMARPDKVAVLAEILVTLKFHLLAHAWVGSTLEAAHDEALSAARDALESVPSSAEVRA